MSVINHTDKKNSKSVYQCCLLTALFTCVFLHLSSQAQAQSFSHDGQRWYEVELSIFSHTLINTPYAEQFDFDPETITFPDSAIELSPAIASLLIDFDNNSETNDLVANTPLTNNFVTEQDSGFINANGFVDVNDFMNPALPEYGAEFYSGESSFRLQEPEKDSYISLGSSVHQFTRHNQRLDNSLDHRLLYHAVWRQPVLNKSQASPIRILGGEQIDAKHELEGTVTISYNVNRIDIDTELWFFTFSDSFLGQDDIEQAYLMNETRSMISGNIHYLDHPAFGLMVEVRPYVLPLSENQESAASNFE